MPKLSPDEEKVLLSLYREGELAACPTLTVDEIAKETGLTEDYVIIALMALKKMGYIENG